ncbi:DNA cytosine methyltransferase [Halonatronum saccharophilum]|uniref:DNA cytosine methyltransferase n=1 Tax=Halonatronum saccharophilum TaxID=150060 RepID=UPI0004BAE7C6|nr:DNA cytosine methyltransferase [Halonatronum saccharophilum]
MKFYTIKEIAEICKVSQKTVRRQISADFLKAKKIGNQWRIKEEDFKNWVDKDFNEMEKKEINNWINNNINSKSNISNDEKKQNDIDEVNWVDISDEWERNELDNGFNYIDLFSGAGGLSLGFKQAGFKGLAGVEIMDKAADTYRTYFDHPVIEGDIREEESKQKLYDLVKNKEIDVICGGFPCKGFSLSGYRIITDSRNNLYKEMLEVVSRLKPKFIMMENVVGLRSMLDGKVEEKIINDFEKIGYKINVTVLNSADYYVPQVRRRVIFIGNRLNKTNYHPNPLIEKENHRTIKDAIEDLIDHPKDKEFNHVPTRHSKDMKERLAAVEEGNSLYGNYSDAWKKSPWLEPSCTVKENHGGVNIHPKLPRVITAREMARLQSFPDDFIFKGAKKWQLKQLGNAVPPLLAKAIAIAIEKSLKS